MLTAAMPAVAQIAYWKVAPDYDAIVPLENTLLKVTRNGKTGLLDPRGNELLDVAYDEIGPFVEGYALLYEGNQVVGFVGTDGKVVDLRGKGYKTISTMDYFSDGLMPMLKGDKYVFLDTEGKEVGPLLGAVYPFYDGYASVDAYVDPLKKPNETYHTFLDKTGKFRKIDVFNKPEDLMFLSSFRDGKAVAVYKKKAYLVDADLNVVPLSVDTTLSKKSIITFENKNIVMDVKEDGSYVLTAKNAVMTFNSDMQLDQIDSGSETIYEYIPRPATKRNPECGFEVFENNSLYGLKYNGKTVLPEQFESVVPIDGLFAVVKLGGKWGVITLDRTNQIVFKLNNNEHIGFNHRYFTARLTTLMPSYIRCANATVVSKSDDCEIQIESRKENENVERNALAYDCRLSIPSDLSDTLSDHTYVYGLNYDGLKSVDYEVVIPEWYVKYYEVELSQNRFSVSAKDTITVEFDLVKTDAARNDETNYFKTVELLAPGSEEIPLTKITENHYSFRVGGDRDRQSFVVKITETGCPSIEYPFEMVFVKPAPKSKDKTVSVTVNPVQKSAPKRPTEPEDIEIPIYIPK